MLKLQQMLARFLRKRGWVVFYLDEQARSCAHDHCWLQMYEQERKAARM